MIALGLDDAAAVRLAVGHEEDRVDREVVALVDRAAAGQLEGLLERVEDVRRADGLDLRRST